MTKKRILFCGGGSLGHVMPSIAVSEALRKLSSDAEHIFVCDNREDEREALRSHGYRTFPLTAPKLPRTLSLDLLLFPWHFFLSLLSAWTLVQHERPSLVFSKGGFVSVPVCLVAWARRCPIVLHTSDSVANISDRLIGLFAQKICTGFSTEHVPLFLRRKAVQTGNPVRDIFRNSSPAQALKRTGFSGKKPVIMIIGGSQGAQSLNSLVERSLDRLLSLGDIIHITGRGKSIHRAQEGYWFAEILGEELVHFLALADLVISRAGAGALSELAALKKPAILVPLRGVAHDHQCKNAEAAVAQGAAEILEEDDPESFARHVELLLVSAERRRQLGERLAHLLPSDAAERVAKVVVDTVR